MAHHPDWHRSIKIVSPGQTDGCSQIWEVSWFSHAQLFRRKMFGFKDISTYQI